MRLYQNSQGYLVGTQAHAKETFDKGDWEEVDVPTKKDELMQFINNMVDTFMQAEHPAPPAEPMDASGEKTRTWDRLAIEEFIAEADLSTAVGLAEHASLRVIEHSNDLLRDATDRQLDATQGTTDGSDLIG